MKQIYDADIFRNNKVRYPNSSPTFYAMKMVFDKWDRSFVLKTAFDA